MISDTLLASKQALEQSTLFKRWVRDNPRESARVESYWEAGGAFPQTNTAFGLHYALEAKAYRDSLPQGRTLTPLAAAAAASTPPTDGVDVAIHPLPAQSGVGAARAVLAVVDPSLPFIPA